MGQLHVPMAGRATQVFILLLLSAPQANATGPTPAIEQLKEAVEYYKKNDFGSCAGVLEKLHADSVKNPDAALFLRAQCRFYSGKPKQAKEDFLRLQRHYPQSPHADLAAWREADCAWKMGQRKKAVALYENAAAHHRTDRADAALGLAKRSIWFYDHGKVSRGMKLWFSLRKNFPLHPLASDAPPGRQDLKLTFEQSMQLARALRKASAVHRALAVLEAAPEPTNKRQKLQLLKLTGLVLFDTRENYQQAARILLRVRDGAKSSSMRQEAWFYASRALGRANKDKQAIASHLAMVHKYPKGKYSARALFYAGWLHVNRGNCKQAQVILHQVREQYPSSKWSKQAAWFSAWCDLRSRHWEKAIKTLAPLSLLKGYEQGARASYWLAVALDASGKHKKAERKFLDVISHHPLTWYSSLARIRLGDHSPALAVPPKPSKRKKIRDTLLEKAGELVSAGLLGFARQLLRAEEKAFILRHPTDYGLEAIMDMYWRSADANRPWYLTLTRHRNLLRTLPGAGALAFWRYAYPAYRRDLLMKYSGDDPQMSLFLQAIMRTESGFDQMALSSADARGLLQMLPSTASLVARKLNMKDFSAPDLFDPEVNIKIASWYIGRLVKKFKGQWPLAAAAYNAGQKPMEQWLGSTDSSDIDEFVERIPYTESRRYAKRVFTAMLRYAWLENLPMPKLEMHMDRQWLRSESE